VFDWRGVSYADFSADGKADILLRNLRLGYWWRYTMDGNQITQSGAIRATSGLDWELQLK